MKTRRYHRTPVAIRAVFFDAGETLVHPYPSFPELFAQVLEREGHPTDPEIVRRALHLVSDRFAQAARSGELWSTSAERSKQFWISVYRRFLERIDVPADDGLADRLYTTFTDLSNYRLFPDAPSVLESLRGRNLFMGLVSNFEEWLERLLDALDVTRYFEVVVISGVEGVEKPDPAIFRLALERSGMRPEESAYVGDNPFFDVEPAAQVGMLPVLIDRRNRYPDHQGVRISSLEDLPATLGLEGA